MPIVTVEKNYMNLRNINEGLCSRTVWTGAGGVRCGDGERGREGCWSGFNKVQWLVRGGQGH